MRRKMGRKGKVQVRAQTTWQDHDRTKETSWTSMGADLAEGGARVENPESSDTKDRNSRATRQGSFLSVRMATWVKTWHTLQ